MKQKIKIIAYIAALLVFLAGSYLTAFVAPLDENGKPVLPQEEAENVDYLSLHWQEMMDEVNANAVDLAELLQAAGGDLKTVTDKYCTGSGKNFTITSKGIIIDANTTSKAAYLVFQPADVQTDYVFHLQIGPIFKGTALRDSLTCIKFSDFDNQMEWSALSSEIAQRIKTTILDTHDMENMKGKTVSFTGCFTLGSDKTLKIMPVVFSEE